MNKFRGVRRTTRQHTMLPLLLLGLLAYQPETEAATLPAAPPAVRLHAAPNLKPHQWCVLDMARDLAAGSGLEQTFQAIVLQESSAGEQLENRRDPSYGAAGMKLGTAKMLAEDMSITAGNLVSDTELNLKLGSAMLEICHIGMGSWRRTVACYNHGGAGAAAMTDVELATDAYVLAITRRLNELQAIRRHASTCPRD